MSSRSDHFECRWRPSRALLTAYLSAMTLALIALLMLEIPLWAKAASALLCLLHAVRVLPRSILLSDDQAFTGLRRDADGWQLWSQSRGWQPVQLCRDSLALPLIVVLRFRMASGGRLNRLWIKSLCIPRDAQAPDVHRRLRLRLKFSRRRWVAAE